MRFPLVLILFVHRVLGQSNCTAAQAGQLAGSCTDAERRLLPGATPRQIVFSQVPPATPNFHLHGSPDFNPYLHIKSFLRFVQPHPLPLEILQLYMQGNASTSDLIKKILELEAGFLTLILFAVVLSLVVPIMTFGLCTPRPTSPPSCAPNCKRRTLVFILHIVLFFLLLGGGGMLWTNSECSKGVSQAGDTLTGIVQGAAGLWSGVLLQLQHLLTRSFEEALFPLSEDINNAENLLGRPIQVELVLETGLDNALENLKMIAAGAKEVCSQVSALVKECGEAESAAGAARTALEDLTKQLDLVRHGCKHQDKLLCDSVAFSPLLVKLSTSSITNSSYLRYLKQSVIDGLSNDIIESNNLFTELPEQVEKQSKIVRQSIMIQLNHQRTVLYNSATSFNKAKQNVHSDLEDIGVKIPPAFQTVQYIDYWRWLIGLVSAISVLYIWSLLTGATCCGCCGSERSSSPTLIVTVILVSLFSFFLWIFMISTFIIGGHAEVFICQALEKESDFSTFSKIIDTGGILTESGGSYLSTLLLGNSSISMPFGKVIQKCERNESAYGALKLKNLLDIGDITNITKWTNVMQQMQQIQVNIQKFEILTPSLHSKLTDLMQGLKINISGYRAQVSGPVSNDLEIFASQLTSAAHQIGDMSTAAHLETLAENTRHIVATYIKDLEQHKENLIYQLTALELKINPLLVQVNQSLSHMKAIQYFIKNQGDRIAQEALDLYTSRMLNYLEQYHKFVQENLKNIPCKSLYELYNYVNIAVCRLIIDPLNGFWFSTLWCLIIFLIETPICLKLIDYYSQAIEDSDLSTSQSYTNGSENGEWMPEPRERGGW
nr:prominin-1 isoform X1 [Halyomorpha halys]